MMNQRPIVRRSSPPWIRPTTAGICLAVWFVILCFFPDPRPLSAPKFAVNTIQNLSGFSEPISRAAASIFLRAVSFGLLGLLTASGLSGLSKRVAIPLGIIVAVGLAVVSQWVNYGYMPVATQLKVSIPSALIGALVGFALGRSRFALIALVAVVVGLYVWGTSINISSDLEAASRLIVDDILEHADEIRDGDNGFSDAMYQAFSFAEDNSHRGDLVQSNKAAILALGIIFGDEKIAKIARTDPDPAWPKRIEVLRQRVSLRGRNDSPRHFSVSAALVVLTDETRATAVGTGKELLDSNPGGSGFSFADLAANRAGILFALAATRDAKSARATQMSITGGGLTGDDYCPEIADLPEGLTRDQFQTDFGGLAGAKTRDVMATIEQRMTNVAALQGDR